MIDFKKASLQDVLNHKTMYYDKIDFSIVKESWDILSKNITLPYVIHIVGTNGKGTTGRFLAHYLNKKSFSVLHYSSPHILEFNERIWINGEDSSNSQLENANEVLQKLLPQRLLSKLTYFEYSTLLAIIISNNLDYLILEAGLGGEFDATNVVKSDLSLITTIDLDHQSFLGNSIEEIARTKMRSVDTKMIIGYQVHEEVYDVANKVKEELLKESNKSIKIDKINDFNKYKLDNKFASYLKRNLHLSIAALNELKIDIDETLFNDISLQGRCQKIKPNVTIDVGHNPLAASCLLEEFKGKKIHLIYNSYKDKDYEKVLKILKPIIKELSILELDDKRIVEKNNLLDICRKFNIMTTNINKLDDNKEYLVFGSFLVIEKFIKNLGFYEK